MTSPVRLKTEKTWLSANVPNEDLFITGFNSFGCDRKSKGGGVLIYEKQKYFTVHLLNSSSLPKKCDYVVLDICVDFLLNKLLSVGFNASVFYWLKSYLSDGVQTVVADGFKSSPQNKFSNSAL